MEPDTPIVTPLTIEEQRVEVLERRARELRVALQRHASAVDALRETQAVQRDANARVDEASEVVRAAREAFDRALSS